MKHGVKKILFRIKVSESIAINVEHPMIEKHSRSVAIISVKFLLLKISIDLSIEQIPSTLAMLRNCLKATSRIGFSKLRTDSILCHQSGASFRFSSLQLLSSSSLHSSSNPLFCYTPEVDEALSQGHPVVALESTIVAHGMPYPQNYQVACDVNEILRSQGVTPATIALRNNRVHIGLSDEHLHELALAGSQAKKVSTREVSLFLGKHTIYSTSHPSWGATTVASTMILANQAGISTFVTGGIGGVHRGGHISMDISADLMELSRTPVVVVCAGIKSLLDIPRTLEVLESLAVPAVTWGEEPEFPAFFSPRSGVPSPWCVRSPNEVAECYMTARSLGVDHGMLVGVPNRDPAGQMVEDAIQQALELAAKQGITGQAVTPFLLRTIAKETQGESLRSNISLVKNNAKVGAEIAIAIAEKKSSTMIFTNADVPHLEDSDDNPLLTSNILVLGGAVRDIIAKSEKSSRLLTGTSNPGTCHEADGGVGRNVAEVLCRLGCKPLIYSAIGDDDRGRAMMKRLADLGGHDHSHVVPSVGTATYLALLDGTGDLHTAVADMQVFSHITVPNRITLKRTPFVLLDANPPVNILEETAQIVSEHGGKVCFEPTSIPKARLVAENAKLMSCISYAFPNLGELMGMADRISDQSGFHEDGAAITNTTQLRHEETAATLILHHMHPLMACLIVTMGDRGVLLATKAENQISFHHFPVQTKVEVENATGAGDSLCGAFLAAILHGKNHVDAVEFGMEAAKLSVQSATTAISPNIDSLKNRLTSTLMGDTSG
jgi:pseudouridylate synthase / pseudouridine kinase